jgi:regulatory protein
MPLKVSAVERDAKGRYLIYCEGEDEPVLAVREDLLVRHRLLKGTELDENRIAEIAREADEDEAYRAAMASLGRGGRTRKELEALLRRKGFAERVARPALDRLAREGWLDDGRYAREFARARAEGYYKGRNLIRSELLRRGVSRSDADEAIRVIDPETERRAAVEAARKKWPSLRGEKRDRVRKLAQFLYRRGYAAGIVREAVRAVAGDAASEAEEAGLFDD